MHWKVCARGTLGQEVCKTLHLRDHLRDNEAASLPALICPYSIINPHLALVTRAVFIEECARSFFKYFSLILGRALHAT